MKKIGIVGIGCISGIYLKNITNLRLRGRTHISNWNLNFGCAAQLPAAFHGLHKEIAIVDFQDFGTKKRYRFIVCTLNLDTSILENQSSGGYKLITVINALIHIQISVGIVHA